MTLGLSLLRARRGLPAPRLEDVLALPGTDPERVAPEHIDRNGHVTVHIHVRLASHGAHDAVLARCGVTDERRGATGWTVFTAEHHVEYRAEIRPDTRVAVHARVLERSDKVVVMTAFVVDVDRGVVTTVLRTVVVSVDLASRRPVEFPADVAARIDALLAEHRRLPWTSPPVGDGTVRRPGRPRRRH